MTVDTKEERLEMIEAQAILMIRRGEGDCDDLTDNVVAVLTGCLRHAERCGHGGLQSMLETSITAIKLMANPAVEAEILLKIEAK